MAAERLESDSRFSATRLLGTAAFLGGGAYGINKTLKSVPRAGDLFTQRGAAFIDKSAATFQGVRKYSAIRAKQNAERIASSMASSKTTVGVGSFTDILGDVMGHYETSKLSFSGGKMTTKQLLSNIKSPELQQEIQNFLTNFEQRGLKAPDILGKFKGDHLGHVKFSYNDLMTNKRMTFDLFPETAAGEIYTGENLQHRKIARRVAADFGLSLPERKKATGPFKSISTDVAIMQKYNIEFDNYLTGSIDPYTHMSALRKRATQVGRKHGAGSSALLEDMRRAEIITDPFGEFEKGVSRTHRAKLLEVLTTERGLVGGTASQFSKGIVISQESPIHRGIIGMADAPTSSQYARISKFSAEHAPTIQHFGPKYGSAGLGQFNYFQLEGTKENRQLFKNVMEYYNPGIGELAAEEMLMHSGMDDVKIANTLYSLKMNVNDEATKTSKKILERMASQLGISTKTLGEYAARPGGLSGVLGPERMKNLNVNVRDIYLNAERHADLAAEKFRQLKQSGAGAEDLMLAETQMKTAKAELAEFNFLSIGEGRSSKLPTTDFDLFITDAMISKGGKMTLSTRAEYSMDAGTKIFGAAKGTIKSKADVSMILAQMHYQKDMGDFAKFATRQELSDLGYLDKFEGTELLGFMNPIDVDSGITQRRVPDLFANYLETRLMYGEKDLDKWEKIEDLFKLKEQNGKYLIDPSIYEEDPRKLIERIVDIESGTGPRKTYAEAFRGTEVLIDRGIGAHFQIIASADVASVQSGTGKLGGVTERTMRNLMAQGLTESYKDIAARGVATSDPFYQFQLLADASDAAKEGKIAGLSSKHLDALDVEALFAREMTDRTAMITNRGWDKFAKDGTMYVNLEKEIGGISTVPLFTQEELAPIVGAQIGSEEGVTELDRATKKLIMMSKDKQASREMMEVAAREYRNALQVGSELAQKAMFKQNILGSSYAQAASSISGLDALGYELGAQAGQKGFQVPVVAMTRKKILESFGEEGLKQANQGLDQVGLWGIVTREPQEGVHSTLPARIFEAESVIDPLGKMSQEEMEVAIRNLGGHDRVFLGGEKQILNASGSLTMESPLRAGLMVDFDKDFVNVIAMKGANSNKELSQFMLGERGKYLRQSLIDMANLGIKGKTPINYMEETAQEIAKINASAKHLEKEAIGHFSNEFKTMHFGLLEQAATGGGAKQYYEGETLAHSFVENIIKAKHQTKETLRSNAALKSLQLLRGQAEYASMGVEAKNEAFQAMMDDMFFGGIKEAPAKEIGARVRRMDFGRLAVEDSDYLQRIFAGADDLSYAISKGETAARITSMDNISNVLKAHMLGKEVQAGGGFESRIMKNLMGLEKPGAQLSKRISGLKAGAGALAKNIGLYGVLPAAGIGLVASLFDSSPQVISAPANKGIDHENSNGAAGNMQKTVYSIPPSRAGFGISGTANRSTNIDGLAASAHAAGGRSGLSISDRRAHMDKYTVNDMVTKGY